MVCMCRKYELKGGCNMGTVQEISGGERGSWSGCYRGGPSVPGLRFEGPNLEVLTEMLC